MKTETALELGRVGDSSVAASPLRTTTHVAFPSPTTMPFSIHLRLPVPTPETGTGGFVRSLLAIKEHIVDRFDGSLHSWHEGRPSDGSRPDPWVHVLLTFDDTVDLLEVFAALNQLYADSGFMAPEKRDAE